MVRDLQNDPMASEGAPLSLECMRELLGNLPGFLPYFPEPDIAALLGRFESILRSGILTKGVWVDAFERAARELLGHEVDAIAVCNATIALEGVLRAIGVEGREVLVPANTFVATASAVRTAGGRVRFVDIDPTSLAPDLHTFASALGPDTGAVVLCHMGGLIAPDVPAIAALCRQRNVACVEDAAQALGVLLDGRPAGTFGDAAVISFFPGKVVTAGEGGLVITANRSIAARVRALRDQGRDPDRVHRLVGHNWRMTELQAALGEMQLQRLEDAIAARTAIAKQYSKAFGALGVGLPIVAPGVRPNWYKFWLQLPSPSAANAVIARLRDQYGMPYAGPIQGHIDPCHLMPAFADSRVPCPTTEWLCATQVGLPLYPGLEPKTVGAVTQAVGRVVSEVVYGESVDG